MAWRKTNGVDENTCMAGDDSLYEATAYYEQIGGPGVAFITYYVTGNDEQGYGVEYMHHIEPHGPDGGDEDIEYDYGCALSYDTQERAEKRALELAEMDESSNFTT